MGGLCFKAGMMEEVGRNNIVPRYPIGVQSFEELRANGYLYVDKTGYIPSLLSNKYYFMSRPRRFGKSLFLSTLESYFKGHKELFEGLAIHEVEKEWVKYPVVHIDFNTMNATDVEELKDEIRKALFDIISQYQIEVCSYGLWSNENYPIGTLFEDVVVALHNKYGRQVVVLVDEYDKPFIEVLDNETMRDNAIAELRPFFGVLKSADKYIKFAFLTGVSRFRNTTIFSGANNLLDISMDREYGSLMGISHGEMLEYFNEGISGIAEYYGVPFDKMVETLRDRYDGYRFTRAEEWVYNPFSLLNAFKTQTLDDYWVMSGSSKILSTYLRESEFAIDELTSEWVSANQLASTYSKVNPVSLFFQTGYLTIDKVDGNLFLLKIPNEEVQGAMAQLIIPEFVQGFNDVHYERYRARLLKSIKSGDVDAMMTTLRSLLAGIPYEEIVDMKLQEKHLHLCLYIIFLMLGTCARCEISQSGGRLDMVAQTPWRVYVFEFKIDETPEAALSQIEERGYAIPYEGTGKEVLKIGVNFSSRLRTIESWKVV